MQQRLQKLIAAAGMASRRKAEQMILAGEVTVNGHVVTELGTKADPEQDHIKVKGKLINPKLAGLKKQYVLLNKPKGYLSSRSDPKNRPLVIDLLPANLRHLHPVGRLDFNSEGIILLTNDGELTRVVTSAAAQVEKVYEVKVKGEVPEQALSRLRNGIVIDGRRTLPVSIRQMKITDAGNAWYQVTLYEGRNNQIRRMFDAVGHSVVKLRRVRIGHLTCQGLAVGAYRLLSPAEVAPFLDQRSGE
ncbi:MAG: pseudouridine synthase [Acidobacteriota bacterium]|nr:rRNA pseudouridine synthase [Blastocatellia bacterium]MDW8412456.1 pseudouridine synthase [Acidobacteriota bacterium]